MSLILAFCAFLFTVLGGVIGIKHHDKLHLILGFTAGILLSVVSFGLLPEIMELIEETGMDPVYPMTALVAGFLGFHILEKLVLLHHSHDHSYGEHKHPHVGIMSALAISGHAFLDGVGIGLGFQVSPITGALIATAVVGHAFSDGLNTVSLMLLHKNTSKKALVFLMINAIAPVLGVLSTMLFNLPAGALVLYLGFFAGFLLYIGASEILPEAHSKNSSVRTILMTLLGVGFIFLVTRLA